EGVAAVRRLAGGSDVLIENFRPGLMSTLGLALADLRSANPRLVTCSLTAFGEETPESAGRPGYDIIMQALSGLMSVTGDAGGEVLGHPEWAIDDRFATNGARVANRDAIVALLSDVFATRTCGEWLAALEAAAVPCSPIRSMDEVFASAEGAALIQVVPDPGRGEPLRLVADPIRLDGHRLRSRMAPPRLGEHTDHVLGSEPEL